MGNSGRFSTGGKPSFIPKKENGKQAGLWKDAGGWARSEKFSSKPLMDQCLLLSIFPILLRHMPQT